MVQTGRELWAKQTQLLAFIRQSESSRRQVKDWQVEVRKLGRQLLEITP